MDKFPFFYLKLFVNFPIEVLQLIYTFSKFIEDCEYKYLYDSIDIMSPIISKNDKIETLILNVVLFTKTNPLYIESDRPMNVNMSLKVSGKFLDIVPNNYELNCWDLEPSKYEKYNLNELGIAFKTLPILCRGRFSSSILPYNYHFSIKPYLKMNMWEKKNWDTFKNYLVENWII